MQIEARRIMCRPHTNRICRRRVERPDFSAGFSIKRLERPADAIFRTSQTDQYLAIHRSGRGRHRITLEWIGELLAPYDRARFRVECDEFGIERGHIDQVAKRS